MSKLIRKESIIFENGRFYHKDEEVNIEGAVAAQLNKLELMVQQYQYLEEQEPYSAGPSLAGFERKTAIGTDRPYIDAPETPVLDKRAEEAKAFMEEIDSMTDAKEVNRQIDAFGELIDWCAKAKVPTYEGLYAPIVDTPVLGNPLELTTDTVVEWLTKLTKRSFELNPAAECMIVNKRVMYKNLMDRDGEGRGARGFF